MLEMGPPSLRAGLVSDEVRRFELLVLRPLWLALIVVGGYLALRAQWLWVGATVVGLFYLGVIGSKLHPLQSAGDLARGPLTSPAALLESIVVPQHIQRALVGRACTRVGLLAGAASGAVVVAVLGFPWYVGLVGVLLGTSLTGAILKVLFAPRYGG